MLRHPVVVPLRCVLLPLITRVSMVLALAAGGCHAQARGNATSGRTSPPNALTDPFGRSAACQYPGACPWAPHGVGGDDTAHSNDANGKGPPAELLPERTIQTKHTMRLAGGALSYTATAGTLHLRGANDQAEAEVFYVAFVADRVADPSTRPVTFAFNGGPGSSAVWLQLGVLGPRRVAFPDAVAPPPPPYAITDNEHSLLAVSDLVFIDPVGTGFSRHLGDAKPENFQGLRQDARAVADFIRRWTARNGRWNSPKFLAGESYGTTRAAALVDQLQGDGMVFNGVILVSSILDFSTARFEVGNDLPYVLYLPTYAATAAYHKRVTVAGGALPAFVDEVRRFALDEYQPALLLGARLPAARRDELATKLAAYTGIPAGVWIRSELRLPLHRFTKELRRDEGLTVGRLDSRYTGSDADSAGDAPGYDPSYTAILGPYTAAMNHYVRYELGFADEHKYEILSGEVNQRWNWEQPGRTGYVNVATELAHALRVNPHLKVYVANGYFDLATPFFATEYTVDHLQIPQATRGNITMGWFEAGHMMYLHEASLQALGRGLVDFVRAAAPGAVEATGRPGRQRASARNLKQPFDPSAAPGAGTRNLKDPFNRKGGSKPRGAKGDRGSPDLTDPTKR